jgi:hypothetical protein
MLWAKLKEVERCCVVRLESVLNPSRDGIKWRITIQPKAGTESPIVVERVEIKDAVADAMTMVEAAGWRLPSPP